jgi:hypothetical protein
MGTAEFDGAGLIALGPEWLAFSFFQQIATAVIWLMDRRFRARKPRSIPFLVERCIKTLRDQCVPVLAITSLSRTNEDSRPAVKI